MLHLLERVHTWNSENRSAIAPGGLYRLLDHFHSYKGPYRVMHYDDLGRRRRSSYRPCYGILPRSAAGRQPYRFCEALNRKRLARSFGFVLPHSKHDLVDGVRRIEFSECVDKDRYAFEAEELFRRPASHASARTGGGNDGQNAHSVVAGVATSSSRCAQNKQHSQNRARETRGSGRQILMLACLRQT